MPIRQQGQVTVQPDVVFGTGGGRDLHCDVYLPPEPGTDRTAVVLVHGGAWSHGDRTQLHGYGILLARLGYVCITTEYRLSSEAIWPAQLDDVRAALDWLRAHADEYGVDPTRIAVSGNSAGGHLALMLGAVADVAAVIAIYPPTELRVRAAGDPVGLLLGGDVPREAQELASPITHARADFPPTMLVHGNADEVVPVDASFAMYTALIKAGAPVELHVYDGVIHAFDTDPQLGRQVSDLIALFLERKVRDHV